MYSGSESLASNYSMAGHVNSLHKRNIILNNERQHNYLITQGKYKSYMFLLLLSHLQAYFVN